MESILDFLLLYVYLPTVDYIIPFFIIISVIVFIHEYGHYWVAKKCGVKIETFSIGFGKEICGWTDKAGTRWKIAWIPLGGYVKMFGDEGVASNPDDEKIAAMSEEERKVAFNTQSLPEKFAVVAAGPAANFILAIVILTGFFTYYGKAEGSAEVGSVVAESAAASIGLQAGDLITELDGETIKTFSDIQSVISINPGSEITITYIRDGKTIRDRLTPTLRETEDVFGNKVEIALMGISSGGVIHSDKLHIGEAFVTSISETYTICIRTLQAIGQMITGRRDADQISGIARIAEYSGQAASKGLEMTLWFMAILSINLGLINLFPIPMLDGGHLFFYTIEALIGRPLSERTMEFGFRVGLVLLISLMLFATFNDLKHFGIF